MILYIRLMDWVVIFKSQEVYQVELLRQLLLGEDIPAVIMNKKDSAYRVIGEAWLYVPKEREESARLVLYNSDPEFGFDMSGRQN